MTGFNIVCFFCTCMFDVKHLELLKCAIQINLSCLALHEWTSENLLVFVYLCDLRDLPAFSLCARAVPVQLRAPATSCPASCHKPPHSPPPAPCHTLHQRPCALCPKLFTSALPSPASCLTSPHLISLHLDLLLTTSTPLRRDYSINLSL